MCVRPSETAPSTSKAKTIIVLVISIMTICSCGIRMKVSCDVNDINNVITDCKEHPQFGISKEF